MQVSIAFLKSTRLFSKKLSFGAIYTVCMYHVCMYALTDVTHAMSINAPPDHHRRWFEKCALIKGWQFLTLPQSSHKRLLLFFLHDIVLTCICGWSVFFRAHEVTPTIEKDLISMAARSLKIAVLQYWFSTLFFAWYYFCHASQWFNDTIYWIW